MSDQKPPDDEWEGNGENEEYESYPTYAAYSNPALQSDWTRGAPPRRRSRNGRRWWLVVAAALVVLAALAGGLVVYSQVSSFHCLASSSNPVTLNVYYDADAQVQGWLNEAVGDFNKTCSGVSSIKLHEENTAQAMQDILAGRIQPDVWIPASSLWLGLLNADWQKSHHGSNLVGMGGTDTPSSFNASLAGLYGSNTASDQAEVSPSLLQSPVVIAMWKPMAQVLGWPSKPIYWATIAGLSTDPNGWATYGHPEWGHFKFAHTDPTTSDSGLEAILAESYAGSKKLSGLTVADVSSQKTQAFVSDIESSVIHYGNDVDALAEQMFTKGPSYLSAVVMNESLLVQESKKYSHLKDPVVAVYPQDGTMVSDYPFAVPQASWVTTAQKTAANSLSQFLLQSPEQKKAFNYYLRPGNPAVSTVPDSPLSRAYGVNLLQPGKASKGNPPPDPPVTCVQRRCKVRNKVDVILIMDHSGSMNDRYKGASKLEKAKQGLLSFVNLLSGTDGLGLTIFSDDEQVLTPVSTLGPKRSEISDLVNSIEPNGNTRLYDTIADQYATLQGLPERSIKAIVVLTDGKNDEGNLSLSVLRNEIAPHGNDQGESPTIYTIAYGNPQDIDSPALTQIAQDTGGKEYPGTPQSINQVYQQILTQNVI